MHNIDDGHFPRSKHEWEWNNALLLNVQNAKQTNVNMFIG